MLISRDCFWHNLLGQLGARHITSVLIEGGAGVYASALEADVVDKVALYIAPAILGKGALSAFNSVRFNLSQFRARVVGENLLVTGYIHDPYKE